MRATAIDACRVLDGRRIRAIPGVGDVYVLSHVIHNRDDERSVRILERCRAAMSNSARLFIVEKILPGVVDASLEAQRVAMADLHMLVVTGGRERTRAEYERLLERAGFSLERVIRTEAVESVVEARPGPG